MQREDWMDLNSGDILSNRDSGETYIVSDADVDSEGNTVIVLSRVIVARNPQEWNRVRKTVDAVEGGS